MGHSQAVGGLNQGGISRGEGELFALGNRQVKGIGAAQGRAAAVLQPGLGLEEIAPAGFHELQAFAAEAIEFAVDGSATTPAKSTSSQWLTRMGALP
jgi:hypothetical protein